MSDINLLPWRYQRQQQKSRRMAHVMIITPLLCLVCVYAVMRHLDEVAQYHVNRNSYLQTQIWSLNEQIKESVRLQSQQKSFLEKIMFFDNLQNERVKIIPAIEDIVRDFPNEAYLTRIKKTGDAIILTGVARSHNEIAQLMKKYDSSHSVHSPELNIIRVVFQQGLRLSEFDISLSYRTPRKKQKSKKEQDNV